LATKEVIINNTGLATYWHYRRCAAADVISTFSHFRFSCVSQNCQCYVVLNTQLASYIITYTPLHMI